MSKHAEYQKNYYERNRESILKRRRERRTFGQKELDYQRKWRASNTARWKEVIVSTGRRLACEICGYDKCFAALEFHHNDPSKKEVHISKLMECIPTDQRAAELEKVRLVCANCHREIHFGKEEV